MTVEVDQGFYQAPCKLTVKDWLEIWTAEYLGDVKEATAYLYRKNADQYIVPSLGAVKLEALTAPMVQALYNDLLKPQKEDVKPLSAKTIKNVHGVFHEALQQAVQVGYLRTNPTDACKPPRVAKPEIHPLDEPQMTDFLAALRDHPHEHPYQITLFTGLREVEVLGLTWDCLDFEHGTLLVKQQLRREQKKRGEILFLPAQKQQEPGVGPGSLCDSIVSLAEVEARRDALESRGRLDRKQFGIHQSGRGAFSPTVLFTIASNGSW
ncbi:tyrosine-type recombinase/integrase [Dysosmobacter sp.]